MRPSPEQARVAVETANAILSGRMPLVDGCVVLAGLADRLVPNAIEDADLVVFVAIASETDDLPIQRVRHLWSANALREADDSVSRYTTQIREEVERACRNVVERFGASR